jgi:DNA-binding response OmpR family regulator
MFALGTVEPPLAIQKRVLVVDGNRDAADLLGATLKARGCEVEVAYDGESALLKAIWFGPDVALWDIGPSLPNYAAARRLRRACSGDELLLIALSVQASAVHMQAIAAGFDQGMTKPLNLPLLFVALSSP